MTMDAATLPVPGLLLGRYPLRGGERESGVLPQWVQGVVHGLGRALPQATGRSSTRDAALIAEVRAHQVRWLRLSELERRAHLGKLRQRLAAEGLAGAMRARALGCVCAAAQRVLQRSPYDTQILCAAALLDDHLAEMATGEGKTLAAGLAAAVAALAGIPVHVLTANDYLAARDAAELAPLYLALGLRTGVIEAATPAEARPAAYACDLTYATAREVAFDHLRDRAHLRELGGELEQHARALSGEPPAPLLLRGLCMAIVDEADSLLIDEATMPLVLAESHDDPGHRAACFQALMLARRLQVGEHAILDAATLGLQWTEEGTAALEQFAAGLGGAWLNRRHRQDLVGAAMVALHGLLRDQHYLVREQRVELLDAVTGRAAAGRVWSRGLQTLVELKEGCTVSPVTRTSAQTSYQRFFASYWRLSGISGTLAECRAELAAVYGKRIVAVPLRCPSRRVMHPHRLFPDQATRAFAVVMRVRALVREGRPVLIGVDTVAGAAALSTLLDEAGLAHRVLDASHDADEAAIVARAGVRGAVTVATRMAGRGTDIALGEGVAALGGLHVICCQDNPSARLDRQLVGRAARQGDPGSAEIWLSQDVAVWQSPVGAGGAPVASAISAAPKGGRQPDEYGAMSLPQAAVASRQQRMQGMHEKQGMRQRRRLTEQDRTWQSQLEFTHLHA